MYKFLLMTAVTMVASQSFATTYDCSKFEAANARHIAIEIDTTKNTAIVDTIGTNSTLKLDDVGSLESLPPQRLYRFSGKLVASNGTGVWKLAFNETRATASLSFVNDATGKLVSLGQTECLIVK